VTHASMFTGIGGFDLGFGATMFAFCTVPCTTWTGAIIAAGIRRVVCLEEAIYHPLSLELFKRAEVEVTRYRRSDVGEGE